MAWYDGEDRREADDRQGVVADLDHLLGDQARVEGWAHAVGEPDGGKGRDLADRCKDANGAASDRRQDVHAQRTPPR